MSKPTLHKINGPAGAKYSCLVPQKKHTICGKNIDTDTLTVEDADLIFANSVSFLVKNSDKADAVTKKAESKQ
jgi:hypothetical protein